MNANIDIIFTFVMQRLYPNCVKYLCSGTIATTQLLNISIDNLDNIYLEAYYDGPHSSDRIFILLRYDFYSEYPGLKNGK